MSEVEKIYCTEPSSCCNDQLALATMMNNNNNNWQNNPFMYLVWMMFANRMWGNYGNNGFGFGTGNDAMLNMNNRAINDTAIQDQLGALRTQISDNQNSDQIMSAIAGNNVDLKTLSSNLNCDYNALSSAISDVRSGVDRVASQVGFSSERVINAVNLGDAALTSALKDCCCQTKTAVQQAGFDNQLATERQSAYLGSKVDNFKGDMSLLSCQYHGDTVSKISQLGNAVTQGFASVGYQNADNTSKIITAINSAQQKTSDQLSNHWSMELSQALQDAKFEISQLKQNQYLGNLINGGCGCGTN